MAEGIKARVASDDEREATRVAANEGKVAAGDATFWFSVGESSEDTNVGGAHRDDEVSRPDEEDGEKGKADDRRYIAPLEAVPTEGTIRCVASGGSREVEFICRREGEAVFGWRNSCPHEPEVRLDPGWGAEVCEGQIVCHEHGARFEGGEGLCTYGPCRGKVLDPIDVEVQDETVYLTDERFEACWRL
ncbi:(2Fe-2S)-binding protein [Halobacteriales archaeon QS_3_64_16]|nr:MAG: (2Fe-2S)-binding protein [Halobacteriales archaeon QS_3_64_16]